MPTLEEQHAIQQAELEERQRQDRQDENARLKAEQDARLTPMPVPFEVVKQNAAMRTQEAARHIQTATRPGGFYAMPDGTYVDTPGNPRNAIPCNHS